MRPLGLDLSLRLTAPVQGGSGGVAILHDIDPDITSLRTTTTDPGGYAAMDVGLDPMRPLPVLGFLPIPGEVPLFTHVALFAGGEEVWSGRVMRRRRRRGAVRGFTAVGYGLTGLKDRAYRSTDETPDTAGNILWDVLQECAPTLRAQAGANWRDPESEHTRASFSGMFPSAIVDQLCKQGGPGGIPWTFRVYRDRLVYFGPAITGTEPGYRLAFDDTVEWDEDADDMYGSAFVTYTDGGVASSTDVASNSAFAGQWNLDRLIARNVGDMPLTAAILARDTVLAEGAAPRVAAKITLPGWDGLPRPGMAPHPGYLIHAVDTVQIGEEPLQRLIGTGFDWRTGALSLTLGEPARDDVRVQLRQLREDRKRSEQGLHVHGGRLPALRQQAAVGALVDSSGGAADGTLQPLAPVTNSTGGTSTGALVDVRLVPVMTNSTGSVANDVLSALSSITTLTDSTGGTANNALESVGASYSQTVVRNNFADLAAKVNALIAWGTTISANDAETAQLSADTRTALAAVNDDLARLAAAHNAALATINDNVADLAAQVSSLRAALRGARLLP